jgi:hypothetical protein
MSRTNLSRWELLGYCNSTVTFSVVPETASFDFLFTEAISAAWIISKTPASASEKASSDRIRRFESTFLPVFCRLYKVAAGPFADMSSSSSSLSSSKCGWAGDLWREALRLFGRGCEEPWSSEDGVAGLDLAVADAAREEEAVDRWSCVALVDAAFEGRGAGFFAMGTLSVRIVGVAFRFFHVLLWKRFMIRNVLKCKTKKIPMRPVMQQFNACSVTYVKWLKTRRRAVACAFWILAAASRLHALGIHSTNQEGAEKVESGT